MPSTQTGIAESQTLDQTVANWCLPVGSSLKIFYSIFDQCYASWVGFWSEQKPPEQNWLGFQPTKIGVNKQKVYKNRSNNPLMVSEHAIMCVGSPCETRLPRISWNWKASIMVLSIAKTASCDEVLNDNFPKKMGLLFNWGIVIRNKIWPFFWHILRQIGVDIHINMEYKKMQSHTFIVIYSIHVKRAKTKKNTCTGGIWEHISELFNGIRWGWSGVIWSCPKVLGFPLFISID